jgi:hypothetical protein
VRSSDEGGEAGQRSSRSCHVVHNYLAAVQADDCATLRLRVRVRRVIAHRLLPLPGLAQGVVHVGVVVDEGVRVRLDALVFALRGLQTKSFFLHSFIRSFSSHCVYADRQLPFSKFDNDFLQAHTQEPHQSNINISTHLYLACETPRTT